MIEKLSKLDNKLTMHQILILLYILCLLINIISYTEELILSLVYIVLFILMNVQSKEIIKIMIISKTFRQILCYEQIKYLKMKISSKIMKIIKGLLEKKNLKNLLNKLDFEIKKKEKKNLVLKINMNKIRKIYRLYVVITNKIKER